MSAGYSSSSPKKNWSAQRREQNSRPYVRTAQLSQAHLKQMGHLARRTFWSVAPQATQFTMWPV